MRLQVQLLARLQGNEVVVVFDQKVNKIGGYLYIF